MKVQMWSHVNQKRVYDSEEGEDDLVHDFEWTDGEHLIDPLTFQSEQVGFVPSIVGGAGGLTPFGCFSLFIDSKMIWKITKETNQYKQQQEEQKAIRQKN